MDFDSKTHLDGIRYSHPQNFLWVSKLFTSSERGLESPEENKINKTNSTEVLKIGLCLPRSLELQRLFFPLFIHRAASGIEKTHGASCPREAWLLKSLAWKSHHQCQLHWLSYLYTLVKHSINEWDINARNLKPPWKHLINRWLKTFQLETGRASSKTLNNGSLADSKFRPFVSFSFT